MRGSAALVLVVAALRLRSSQPASGQTGEASTVVAGGGANGAIAGNTSSTGQIVVDTLVPGDGGLLGPSDAQATGESLGNVSGTGPSSDSDHEDHEDVVMVTTGQAYPCLPFDNGCGHLVHMCATVPATFVGNGTEFQGNSTCSNFALDWSLAFSRCKDEAFYSNGTVSFASCLSTAKPNATCNDVCGDLAGDYGPRCERSCGSLNSCMGGCTVESEHPSGFSMCVTGCMGPVPEADEEFQNATKDVPPPCETTACGYQKLAAKTFGNAHNHIEEVTKLFDHMTAATATLKEIGTMYTTLPPPEPTPFPIESFERYLATHSRASHVENPFEAFSPATPFPY